MRTPIEILAGVAILAKAIIYGTDVFGAIVLRPAIASVDDRTLTQLLGQVHRVADRRFKTIGIAGLVAAIATTVLSGATGHWVSTSAGALATAALIIPGDLHGRQQAGKRGPDGGGGGQPGPERRTSASGPLGLRHQRTRGAPDRRTRRTLHRARRS